MDDFLKDATDEFLIDHLISQLEGMVNDNMMEFLVFQQWQML
jgi:hypothetical protein